jgi:predicted acylesterase/phospholipase RssA
MSDTALDVASMRGLGAERKKTPGRADWIAYVYLMRVPILMGGILVALPILALTALRPLLQNLFVLDVEGTVWTTAIAFALCWSILLTSRLVRLNGERFGLPQALNHNTLEPKNVWWICLLAVPLIVTQFWEHREFALDRDALLWRFGAVLLGAAIAYLISFVGLFLTVWVAPPGNAPADKTFPAPERLKRLLVFANSHGLPQSRLERLGARLKRLPQGLWIGYLDPESGLLWAGHWLALTFAVSIGSLTFVLDMYRRAYLGEKSPVPALCYVLILLLNLNWILAFLAFLLDRYRIPLLLPLAVFCAIGAHSPSSDHYYSSQSGVPIETITPADVLRARKGKPIILVATAGGGIQAGAWTAQVLSGLQKLSTQQWKTKNSFADSLTLISSVSGGATGSMYFLNLYGPDTQAAFQDQEMNDMNDQVKASSLDDIAWAMVYRDFFRIVFPYFKYSSEDKLLDRGYMLEETWRNRGNIHANLSNWRLGVKTGSRPAAIFNVTIAETGEPLLLSTTDLADDRMVPKRVSFYRLYPNTDVPVVTAVRLAATFPYVSPAARILSGKPEYHMIDGGYYDNPGVSSLVRWIDEGLQTLRKNNEPLPEHILIIQIRSFPDEGQETAPTNRGWFFQAYAPIRGLLSVRTTAQLVRDRDALSTFARLWSTTSIQGSLEDRVRFATFTFDGTDAPLSWAMNDKQKRAIPAGWDYFVQKNQKNIRWVHCTLDPQSSDCHSAERSGPY